MKKHLLLAAATLLGFSSTFAQDTTTPTRYKMGDVIKKADELTSGTYFIRAHANNTNGDMSRGEAMIYDYSNTLAAGISSTYVFPSGFTDDLTYVWNIVVSEDNGENVFTVQNVSTKDYWSIQGDRTGEDLTYPARGSMRKTKEETKIGKYKMADVPTDNTITDPQGSNGYYGKQTEYPRFFLQLTNAWFNVPNGKEDTKSHPYVTTNDAKPVPLGYWENCDTKGITVQFDFVKAELVKEDAAAVEYTFTYPEFGGFLPQPVKAQSISGIDPEGVASAYAPDFFEVAKVEKVTEGNDEYAFKVEGTWNFPFNLDCVGRFNIRSRSNYFTLVPNNSEGKKIATNREVSSTFDPANLFYLTSEGFNEKNRLKVTLHVIALDEKWGLNCSTGNGSIGALSEYPTTWIVKTSNQGNGFALQHSDDENAHINELTDRSDNPNTSDNIGIWSHANSQNDPGSFIRFFGLTEEDFKTTEWEYNGETYQFKPGFMDAVRESQTPDNVRDLFDINNNTTQLGEINAEGGNAGMVYDLQGRRLAAPVRGINIIDGKKVLLNR